MVDQERGRAAALPPRTTREPRVFDASNRIDFPWWNRWSVAREPFPIFLTGPELAETRRQPLDQPFTQEFG